MLKADEILNMHKENDDGRKDKAFRLFCMSENFAPDGTCHILVAKDPESEQEARDSYYRYSPSLGYHGQIPLDHARTAEINIRDFSYFDEKYGVYKLDKFKCKKFQSDEFKKILSVDEAASDFVGKEKEKLEGEELEITGTRKVKTTSDYGDFTVVEFRDAAGNRLHWFQRTVSIETVDAFAREVGNRVLVYGSIFKHETRRGVKSTALKRCEIYDRTNTLSLRQFALRRAIGDGKAGSVDVVNEGKEKE